MTSFLRVIRRTAFFVAIILLVALGTICLRASIRSARARALAYELRELNVLAASDCHVVEIGPCGKPLFLTDEEVRRNFDRKIFTDREFAHVSRRLILVGGPRYLGVCRVRLSQSSLSLLHEMPQLVNLHLERCGVTNEMIRLLVGLKLDYLGVFEAGLTDECVESLIQLRSLSDLQIGGGARLTEQGVQRLRRELPGCRIHVSEGSSAPRNEERD